MSCTPSIKRKVSETNQKILNLYQTLVKLLNKALKGFKKSYEVDIISNDPLEQLTNTRKIVVDKLVENLNMMKGCQLFKLLWKTK